MPQWVQLAGIFIGVPVALVLTWLAWKHRRTFVPWFSARSRAYRIAFVSVIAVVVLGAGGTGLVGYHYMMHDNDFCQSCHVMDTAWNRFQVSAHKTLTCHECHRQPIWVSTKELFWWVLERRMAIPAHDKVPSKVCAECHRQSGTDSTRRNVMLTAGHVVHLKSDSSALKKVQCTTCHGLDFHKFTPNNATCAQSGCHSDKRIKLGVMTQAGFLHCTVCHSFRTPAGDTLDVKKAAGQMSPTSIQCFACHQMTERAKKFDLRTDPHNGGCGTCHNPHKQEEPKDALKTCANNGCHSDPATLSSFHRGLGKHSLDNCSACHATHSWKVKGNECLACHKTIFQDRPSLKKPAPVPERSFHGAAGAATPTPSNDEIPGSAATPSGGPSADDEAFDPAEPEVVVAPADLQGVPQDSSNFPHWRHKAVPCRDCHATDDTHGGLKISRPDGCRSCHHSAKQPAACVSCHATGSVKDRNIDVKLTISARKDPAVQRALPFAHKRHDSLVCAKCHANSATRAVTTTCNSCHEDHHEPQRECASCHPTAREGHDRTAHDGCASCHTAASVARLTTSRPLCIACHEKQRDHEPKGECSKCHLVDTHPGKRA